MRLPLNSRVATGWTDHALRLSRVRRARRISHPELVSDFAAKRQVPSREHDKSRATTPWRLRSISTSNSMSARRDPKRRGTCRRPAYPIAKGRPDGGECAIGARSSVVHASVVHPSHAGSDDRGSGRREGWHTLEFGEIARYNGPRQGLAGKGVRKRCHV